MLHQKHPQRASFSAKEILDQVKSEQAHTDLRAGVQAHIYLHNVANLAPNSARNRMSYKLEDDTYRLYPDWRSRSSFAKRKSCAPPR